MGPPARGAHRLHLRDHRRGARADRHADRARPVRRARLRRLPGRAAHRPTPSSGSRPPGITAWIPGQALINIGAVLGLLPVTGLPLPLVSYGGSALLVTLVALGMLMSFARAEPGRRRRSPLAARPPRPLASRRWPPAQDRAVAPLRCTSCSPAGGPPVTSRPLLAVADALRRRLPDVGITVLGTERGLETRLVPGRGYDLALIPPVPHPAPPRASTWSACPGRLRAAVTRSRRFSSGPRPTCWSASAATCPRRPTSPPDAGTCPTSCTRPTSAAGLANRLGCAVHARTSRRLPGRAAARGRYVGMPLRLPSRTLDRDALRAPTPDAPSAWTPTARPCWSAVGRRARGGSTRPQPAPYVPRGCRRPGAARRRAGQHRHRATVRRTTRLTSWCPTSTAWSSAMRPPTCALPGRGQHRAPSSPQSGLPGVYVPLPIGNGEQRLNARPVVEAGGGLLVDDAACTPEYVASTVVPLLLDRGRLDAMGHAAAGVRSAGRRRAACRPARGRREAVA